jgi:hypothetical protein
VAIQRAKVRFGGRIALQRGAAIVVSGSAEIEGQTFAVFVEIAENKLSIRLILGGAGLKPGERLIVAWGRGISRDEEFLELEASGRITGISARCEFGDNGNGDGDGLRERRGGSGIHCQQRATNTEKEPENAIGEKRERRHFDPLIWVLGTDSCDPSAA